MKLNFRNLAIPLFIGLIIVLSGCTGVNVVMERSRDYYVEETIGGPDSLDPAVCYESAGGQIIQNVYETLYWYDHEDIETVIPWLASDMPTVSADGLNYTIPIRSGITFHDGTEFNATGIKAMINHIMWVHDSGGPGWVVWDFLKGAADAHAIISNTSKTDADRIAAYDAWVASDAVEVSEDAMELTLRLETPYAGFGQVIAFWPYAALSPAAVEEHQTPDTLGKAETENWFHTNMVGTGPYKLNKWDTGVEVVMDANEDYWGTPFDTGVAPIKTVRIQQVDEFSTRKLDIMAGDADNVYWPTTNAKEIYDEDADTNSKIKGHEVITGTTLSVTELHLNVKPTVNLTSGPVDNPLADTENGLKVRKALNHVLDFEEYIEDVVNGFGIEQNGVIPKGMFAHVDDLNDQYGYDYDLDGALALLEDAGYGSDNPLTLYFSYNTGNDVRRDSCLYFKDKLEGLANWINVEVEGLDWSVYVDKLVTGNLMAYIIGWLPDYADPDNYITPYASSTGTFSGWEGYNGTFDTPAVTGHGISEGDLVDDWIQEARIESDDATREAIYEEIEAQLLRDAKYVYLYQAQQFRVQRTWVTGYFNNPVSGTQFYYLDWHPTIGVPEEA